MGQLIDSDALIKGLLAMATNGAPASRATQLLAAQKAVASEYLPALTVNATLATMTGCCALFDPCGSNALLSLTQPGEQFLDWLGWRPNNECHQFVKLLTYMGGAGASTGTLTSNGAIGACADPPGVEFGTCEILLPDKGRIARSGPVRDLTDNNRVVCNEFPVWTLNGEQITDELSWSVLLAGQALLDDLKRMVIDGNDSSTGEFDGLEVIVNTGYVDARNGRRCSSMDAYVLAWGNRAMDTLVNGFALIDYIIDIVRRIRTRAQWSKLGNIAEGDMILMMPAILRDRLLDAFTFWTIQSGVAYNEVNFSNYETRTFRNALNGGTFGDGYITIDGRPLPIITYDWEELTQGANGFIGDIYVLTRRIGGTPVLYGQYIDMNQPAAAFAERAGYTQYKATDGGKFLTYWYTDNTCTKANILMRPNIYCSAPWAQARITGVAGRRPLAPIQPDPTSTYFVEGFLTPATCPEDYLAESI